jgi:hypothetical protein
MGLTSGCIIRMQNSTRSYTEHATRTESVPQTGLECKLVIVRIEAQATTLDLNMYVSLWQSGISMALLVHLQHAWTS